MKSDGYSIKDLEILSGVKAHTIRIWEKRYRLLIPGRTDTNIRFYSDDDLRRILNISLLVKNKFKISKVSNWDETQIKNSVLDITAKSSSESDYIDRLILFMLNFDTTGFFKLTSQIIEEKGIEDAVVKIFFVLFERIGTYWLVGTIFPAQEHYVTNIIRQKLIVEIDKLGIESSRENSILFYLPDGELHEMSLLFYSYLARKMGYNVIYLGQFVPFEDLKKISVHTGVDYVFTAFINSVSKEKLEEYLVNLKEVFQHQKVFVTGYQLQIHSPQLPRSVKIVKDHRDFKKFLG